MIEKRGRQFLLRSKKGAVLGTHKTRADAQAQEKAIQSSKATEAIMAGRRR